MEKAAQSRRVLVVDDDHTVCDVLCETLAAHGFQAGRCHDGDEALVELGRETYDVVISDLNMERMSGMELLQEVRRKYPRTVFLIVTGEDDIRIGVEAMKNGAADYLIKPFDLDGVLASLQRALEVKAMEVELENYRQNLERMVEDRTKQLEAARRRIELTYDETLEALGAALDLRDTETAGHSQRVTRYCLEMAKGMGCSGDQLKQIARGSYLHDIGKIGIPDSILLKEGKLTGEETQVMQTHVRIGYELVSRIAFLAGAAEIVLTHQERYEGTGYPQGLVGNEIPLGARIFSVADTLDAMTSDRPYRRALPFSTARDEIVRESGRQFDPEVVRAFLSVPEQVWENIRLQVAGLRGSLKKPLSSLARPDARLESGSTP
ncbi:MAG: response regulator [Acidobacteria bacterium]|nr:response regulator [Acidobacteriota bacterium]